MENGILQFIDEAAYAQHTAYARQLAAREQLLRRGRVSDERSLFELYRHRTRADTRPLYEIRVEAMSHELYFSSFCVYPSISDTFCRTYGGLTSFFHRLCEQAMAARAFLYIGTERGTLITSDDIGVFLRKKQWPLLCIDVCEHAYFSDYGFERTAYVKAAVGHLDVARLLPREETKEKTSNIAEKA